MYRKKLLLILSILGLSGTLALGLSIGYINQNESASAQSPNSSSSLSGNPIESNANPPIPAKPIQISADGGIFTVDDFLKQGGRSAIVISRPDAPVDEYSMASGYSSVVTVARGSSVKVPMTILHIPGKDPLPSVTIAGKGTGSNVIPPSIAKSTTPEQRTELLKQKLEQINSGNLTVPANMNLDTFVAS